MHNSGDDHDNEEALKENTEGYYNEKFCFSYLMPEQYHSGKGPEWCQECRKKKCTFRDSPFLTSRPPFVEPIKQANEQISDNGDGNCLKEKCTVHPGTNGG
jgi:hypothetical protein